MAELDLNLSQITSAATTIEDTDIIYLIRLSAGVYSDYSMTGSALKAEIKNIVDTENWSTPETLAPNTTHYKNMGAAATYCGAKIKYRFNRNGVVKYGTVNLINNQSSCYQNTIEDFEITGEATGISMPYESQCSAGQMQMTIVIDNQDAENTTFSYKIELIQR